MAEDSSSFKRTVVLRDWWLIKCSEEFEGKRFGVAGTQIAERGAVRVFTSSPIITAFDVFTLQASDGVCIILRGFLNKQRLLQSGFLPQISREFIFGFPPCWEAKCNSCYLGVPSGPAATNSKAAAASILSPCKWNLEDSPVVVVDKNTDEEIDDKDVGSTARDEIPARKKSLRLQAKSVEASILKTSEGLSKGAKSCVAEKHECEAFGFQGNERKLDESKVKKPTNGGDLGVIEGLDKDKSSDVQKWNLEDSPAVVVDKNTEGISDKDGHGGGGGSTARDEIPARKKSLRLQSKSVEACKVNTNHGSKGLSKGAKSGFGGNEGKLDESIAKKPTNVSEGLDKDKSSDVKKDECEVINSKVISPADGCGEKHTGADNLDKRVTSMSAVEESLTSEQGKGGELEATKACQRSLFEDLEKASVKPGKKPVSNKSDRTLRSAGNAVEHVEHSGTKVKTAKNKRKHDVSEVQDPTTNDSVEHVNNSGTKLKKKLDVSEVQNPATNDVGHGSEGLNKAKGNGVEKDECMDNEERPRVDGCGKMHSGTNSKKITSKNARKEPLTSEQRKSKLKIRKGDLDVVVEPMTHSGSKEVKDYLSVGKTIRKIDFDEEVTPEKDGKKQKTNSMSADSLGQKRSRSGRVLVSSLEYWRNQVPVYDADRNLIQVNEGHLTSSAPSKGKGSVSRKPRK